MNKGKLKAHTSAEYISRINKALEYIAQHLDESMRLEEVARSSHFSPYHFHRIFHALLGETVNDYISRKRMEMAARRLVYKPELSVTQVAEMGGFSSSANFAKAFKLYFGVSASALRNGRTGDADGDNNSKIGKLYRKYGKEFKPQDLYSQFVTATAVLDNDKLEEMLMKVKVEEIPEKSIAYITAPNGYALDSIYATWDKLIHWANNQGISDDVQARFAICHDNPMITPEDKCRYDAAIVIEPEMAVMSPYSKSVIPAGKYAIAYYKDVSEKINNFMTELCSQWLCHSGYEPDNYPPMFNYRNDSRKDGYVEMDVYIKVKALQAA